MQDEHLRLNPEQNFGSRRSWKVFLGVAAFAVLGFALTFVSSGHNVAGLTAVSVTSTTRVGTAPAGSKPTTGRATPNKLAPKNQVEQRMGTVPRAAVETRSEVPWPRIYNDAELKSSNDQPSLAADDVDISGATVYSNWGMAGFFAGALAFILAISTLAPPANATTVPERMLVQASVGQTITKYSNPNFEFPVLENWQKVKTTDHPPNRPPSTDNPLQHPLPTTTTPTTHPSMIAPPHTSMIATQPPRMAMMMVKSSTTEDTEDEEMSPSLMPIYLGVFAQMLGEGVAVSTLPLYMKSMGASVYQIGGATSAFSLAQMVCCPLIVSISNRIGRRRTLQACLAGACASSFMIALAPTVPVIILGRFWAGIFAAALPVAQAAVTDVVSKSMAPVALSRVTAANQSGFVIGPALGATMLTLLSMVGVPPDLQVRLAYVAAGLFALAVYILGRMRAPALDDGSSKGLLVENTTSNGTKDQLDTDIVSTQELSKPHPYVQILLRAITITFSWSLTVSVTTYCMFGHTVLGYTQPQISTWLATGAAVTVFTQLILFPRLFKRLGAHLCCTLGLLGVSSGLSACSLFLAQPFHSILYLLNRVGSGIGDTSVATLVAAASSSESQRARNLALIQSSRAGARIVTPILSGSLFACSCAPDFPVPVPGALPYLVVATLALVLSPLPFVLKRHDNSESQRIANANVANG